MGTAIDIAVVVVVILAATAGWRRGLAASALPLAGFVAGVAAGARLGPLLLDGGSQSPYAPAVAAAAGVVLGLLAALALDGPAERISRRFASRPGRRAFDHAGGAILLGLLGLAACWVAGAVALHAPGEEGRDLRRGAQESVLLAAINDVAPPSGPLLRVLRRVDPGVSVDGPELEIKAPPGSIVDDPEVLLASQSVVALHGNACGLGVAGSGWVAASDLVVTNAHVVAGQDETIVIRPDGTEVDGTVVHYDTNKDLAVVSAPGLGLRSLGLSVRTRNGIPGAIIGYPGAGPLTLLAARLGRPGVVESTDSYGRGPIRRKMVPFRGTVEGGNSGGPVVDDEGRVLTTIFAKSIDRGEPPSGVGVPNGVVNDALAGQLSRADTGPCAA